MKKLKESEKINVLKVFPHLDALFENEIEPRHLGYTSLVVCPWKGWLTREGYYQEMDKMDQRKVEIDNARIKILSEFHPDAYLFTRDEELFEIESLQEYQEVLRDNMSKDFKVTFINTKYNVIIEVLEEHTDIYNFITTKDGDHLKKHIESPLYVFENYRN